MDASLGCTSDGDKYPARVLQLCSNAVISVMFDSASIHMWVNQDQQILPQCQNMVGQFSRTFY